MTKTIDQTITDLHVRGLLAEFPLMHQLLAEQTRAREAIAQHERAQHEANRLDTPFVYRCSESAQHISNIMILCTDRRPAFQSFRRADGQLMQIAPPQSGSSVFFLPADFSKALDNIPRYATDGWGTWGDARGALRFDVVGRYLAGWTSPEHLFALWDRVGQADAATAKALIAALDRCGLNVVSGPQSQADLAEWNRVRAAAKDLVSMLSAPTFTTRPAVAGAAE